MSRSSGRTRSIRRKGSGTTESLIDAEFLAKGVKYEALPDRIHFYISEKDIYHCGKAIYPIEKELGGTGLPYDDGVHIFFVNAAVDDGSRGRQADEVF